MKKVCLVFVVLALMSYRSVQGQNSAEEEPMAETDVALELGRAAYRGEVERVESLLESGADVKSWSNLGSHSHTPLMYAVYMGHYEVSKILIEAGADVNAAHSPDHTVLYHALESHRLRADIIQLLMEAGVSMKPNPLFWAIHALNTAGEQSEVPKIVAMLVDGGADVDARDESGLTPLITAACMGYGEFIDILLRAGAEINATVERSGITALGCAVNGKHVEAVRLLVEAGAETGEGLQFFELRIRQPQVSGDHSVCRQLSLSTNTGHGFTHVHRRQNPLVKEFGRKIHLAVRNRDEICRNVGGHILRLSFHDG